MAINLANNNSLANITALPSSISGGAMTLLATQTASGSANLSFTSGIDDTYDSYVFKYISIHPSADATNLLINFSVDGGSNYNVTKTTTFFRAEHNPSNGNTELAYKTGEDLAQSTSDQILLRTFSTENDHAGCGVVQLFSPSNTTFVKHFICDGNTIQHSNDVSSRNFVAGYGNTTSAIDAVRFKMSSGNIDSGVIKLYGVS